MHGIRRVILDPDGPVRRVFLVFHDEVVDRHGISERSFRGGNFDVLALREVRHEVLSYFSPGGCTKLRLGVGTPPRWIALWRRHRSRLPRNRDGHDSDKFRSHTFSSRTAAVAASIL